MSKILINTSNLHVGGGVQVAVSFIDELSKSKHNLNLYDLWLSTEIYDNLIEINSDLSHFNSIKIINYYGIMSLFSLNLIYKILFVYKTVFTLFGPMYVFVKPHKHIMGFAQPSIIYPEIAINLQRNKFIQWILLFKLKLQEYFFTKVDFLIVELEHVKINLLQKKRFQNIPIFIVHNCFSNIFLKPELWQPLYFPKSNSLNIGYLGRNYLHKNLNILPEVLFILKNKFKLNINFYVTLTDEEWNSSSSVFKENIINIGKLSVAQCPSYLSELDGVIFPSLLECFSATPLEGLIMGKPVFLSDRYFNTDVAMDFGFYFDPLNPLDIANVISNYFINSDSYKSKIDTVKSYALNFSNSRGRMEEYIKILNT
jgi:hypothetical protein